MKLPKFPPVCYQVYVARPSGMLSLHGDCGCEPGFETTRDAMKALLALENCGDFRVWSLDPPTDKHRGCLLDVTEEVKNMMDAYFRDRPDGLRLHYEEVQNAVREEE